MVGLKKNTSQGPRIKNNLVKGIPPGLLGKPTETSLLLEGNTIAALLDTESTVSTISHSYYDEHLSDHLPLQNLDTLLDIECAGGTQLPYLGFIEAEITLPKNRRSQDFSFSSHFR